MTCDPVPEQDVNQRLLLQPLRGSPWSGTWWAAQTVTDIPSDALGWLLAQGWNITGVSYDATTNPPTAYYALTRQSLDNRFILQSMLDEYTDAYNLAVTNNTYRYNDIVANWDLMLETSHDQFEVQATEQSDHEQLFLADLTTYMDEIDTLVDTNITDLSQIQTDYDNHDPRSRAFLVDLGATELARINEHFAATLSTQIQNLTDRGLYSSAVEADITERNERDRDEQIQALNDRLMREKLVNDHQLYNQQVGVRTTIAENRHRAIVEKMNEFGQRLAGIQQKHDECMRLLAYQLEERNKILVGLYGFVERRDDIPPSFEALTQIATSLGDAGGGWVTP